MKASAFLDEAAKTDLLKFLRMLADVLRCPGNTAVARMAAGLYLKNQLTAKDERVKEVYRTRWLSFPERDRNYIKASVRK
jgi:importin subunit beta-1